MLSLIRPRPVRALNRRQALRWLLASVGLLLSLGVAAQTTYWDGAGPASNSVVNGGTGTWNATNSNWTTFNGASNGVWPGGTNTATFQGTAGTVTVSGTQSVGGLSFQTSGYTLSSGTLSLANTTGNVFSVDSGIATVGSVISGTGRSLSKEGSGVLVLSGGNTYSGNTFVNNGALRFSGSGTSVATAPLTVAAGASLDLSRDSIWGGPTTAGHSALTVNGTLNVLSPGYVNTFTNPVFNDATVNLNGGKDSNFNATFIFKGTVTTTGTTKLVVQSGTTNGLLVGTNTAGGITTFDVSGSLDVGVKVWNGVDANTMPVTSGLTKTGPGTMTLSVVNAYTGTTRVNAGRLDVTGATSSGSVIVASGGTLGGTGTIGGSTTVQSGGTLSPGVSVGLLSFKSGLSLSAGSSAVLELAQAGTAGGACNDRVSVSGNLTLGGSLVVTPADGASGCASTFGPGSYPLFTYTGTLTNNNPTIVLPSGYAGALDTSVAGTVSLVVFDLNNYWDGAGPANNGVVNGGTGTWNATSTNWTTSSGSNNAIWPGGTTVAVFKGSSGTVTVSGNLSVGGLRFDSTGYFLTGGTLTGADDTNPITVDTAAVVGTVLAGSKAFSKEGAGTLQLTGANTYTGSTTVNQGTLMFSGTGTTPATAPINVAAGATLQLSRNDTWGAHTTAGHSALTVNGTLEGGPGYFNTFTDPAFNGATLNFNGGKDASFPTFAFKGTVTSSRTTNLVVRGGSNNGVLLGTNAAGGKTTFNVSGALNVGVPLQNNRDASSVAVASGLEKTGAGTMTLTDTTNSYTGPTTVTQGTLELGDGSNGADISSTSGVSLASGALLRFNQPGLMYTFDRVISGAGGVVKAGAVSNRGQLTAVNTYTGDTTIIGGRLQIGGSGQLGSGSYAGNISNASAFEYSSSANQTLSGVISGAGSLSKTTNASTLTLSGTNTYTGTTSVSAGKLVIGGSGQLGSGTYAGNISNAAALEYASSADQTLSGVISGTGSLSKTTGAGSLTLSGTNTYTGTTSVSAGKLLVTGSTAGGAVTVASGGTLGGSGTVGGATTVQSGGTLSPGLSPGTLTFGNGLILSAGSTTAFELAQAGTAGGACNDLVAVTGNLTLGGTINITAASGASGCDSTFGLGTYTLFTYSGSLTNNNPTLTLPAGFVGKLDTSQANVVKLVVETYNYWDGAGPANNGVVNGGAGTWNGANSNWTTSDGASNATWPGGTYTAIFQGTAGAVTVSGTQSAGGLTFNTTGYTLSGGALVLADPLGNPLATSSGVTATIVTPLTGGNAVTKAGSGTLVLSGANTYSGGTTVQAGTLRAGANGTLPTTGAVVVAAGATLELDGSTQSLSGLNSSGTLALGTNGQLKLTSGASTLAALTGSGKIIVGAGATLTLGQSLTNTGLAIELAGGTLNLGPGLTHSLGALKVTAAGSVLDFAVGANARATFSSLDVASGAALGVVNWTQSADLFAATAVVGNPARDTINLAPLNRITFNGYSATNTNWRTAQDEITPLLPGAQSPVVRLAVVSNNGVGRFDYSLSNLGSTGTLSLTTTVAGTAVTSSALQSTGLVATLTQTAVPAGWASAPASATCVDKNGATTGNGSGTFGSLSGTVLTIGADNLLAGADITCTFTNTQGPVISGKVFDDGGAPSAGVNTGTPNNGVQDGAEVGLANITASLTNCAGTTLDSTVTNGEGAYSFNVPAAQMGQTLCVALNLPAGRLATGANVGGTPTPDGAATSVGGVSYTYSRASLSQSFTAPASGTLALHFGLVPVSTLISNNSAVAAPGGIVTYSHRFTAGTGGVLKLSTLPGTASPSTVTGWSESLYQDTGCKGEYQPNATLLAPPSQEIAVTQGQELCFVVRQFAPAAALSGYSYMLPVQAQLALSNASPALSVSYRVSDNTQVSDTALQLKKVVRNITTGGESADWSTGNSAKTGDVLEYQITFTNNSAAPLMEVKIQDGTGAWTTWTSATASSVPSGMGCSLNTPANPAPAAGQACVPAVTGSGKGNLTWTLDGSLQPSASGMVTYRVKVD